MNWLKQSIAIIQIALALVPNVMVLVKEIETPGNGPAKAKAVTEFILAGFDLLPDEARKAIGADKIEAFARRVIDTIVVYLNAVGIFKKS